MNIFDGIMLHFFVFAIGKFCICSGHVRMSLIGGFILNGPSISRRHTIFVAILVRKSSLASH